MAGGLGFAIVEPPVVVKILSHIGQPTAHPPLLLGRSPSQGDLGFDQGEVGVPLPFDKDPVPAGWPGVDQTAGAGGNT